MRIALSTQHLLSANPSQCTDCPSSCLCRCLLSKVGENMAYEEGLTDRIIRLFFLPFFHPPFHEGPLLSEGDFVPCSMHGGRIKRERGRESTSLTCPLFPARITSVSWASCAPAGSGTCARAGYSTQLNFIILSKREGGWGLCGLLDMNSTVS